MKHRAAAKEAHFTFQARLNGTAGARNGTALHPLQNGQAPNGHGQPAQPPVPDAAMAAIQESPQVAEKIKDLLRLSQEQGYLTYDDINDALPDEIVTPEVLDAIYSKLRGFEVEIVEAPDMERQKPAQPEEEEESRLRYSG